MKLIKAEETAELVQKPLWHLFNLLQLLLSLSWHEKMWSLDSGRVLFVLCFSS